MPDAICESTVVVVAAIFEQLKNDKFTVVHRRDPEAPTNSEVAALKAKCAAYAAEIERLKKEVETLKNAANAGTVPSL